MTRSTIYLLPAIVALVCNSCIATLFTTVQDPTPGAVAVATKPVPTSTTVIKTSGSKPTTVVVQPTSYQSAEMLDLQAVSAAFLQSSSVQEFEFLLNNSAYYIANLDLNRDGYVDYLRVLETVSGYTHKFVIQAVLAPNYYYEVATLTANAPLSGNCTVRIVGAPALYGNNYVLDPVINRTPTIYSYLRHSNYTAWQSPYNWGYYPTCYTQRAPQYPSHYKGYVEVFLKNHRYTTTTTTTKPTTKPTTNTHEATVTTKVNTQTGRVSSTHHSSSPSHR